MEEKEEYIMKLSDGYLPLCTIEEGKLPRTDKHIELTDEQCLELSIPTGDYYCNYRIMDGFQIKEWKNNGGTLDADDILYKRDKILNDLQNTSK